MMAKRQTRRTISFRAELFAAMEKHCREHGIAMAAFAEDACRNMLATHGVAMPSHEEAVEYLRTRSKSRPGPKAWKPAQDLPPQIMEL